MFKPYLHLSFSKVCVEDTLLALWIGRLVSSLLFRWYIPALAHRFKFGNSWIPVCLTEDIKGTQDWEFFWLRFWNLRYFFVSYVKILRFYKKIFLIGPLLGEVRFFRVVLGLQGMKTFFEPGQKILFLSSIMDPKYDPLLIFWKFNQLNAPGRLYVLIWGKNAKFYSP